MGGSPPPFVGLWPATDHGLDVLGPAYHHRAAEVYIDDAVLESEVVEEKDEILKQGEQEKLKRREDGEKSQH